MTIRRAQCEGVNDGTTRCPHCEYTLRPSMFLVGISMVAVGILLSLLTVIGAVLGIRLAVVGPSRIYKSSTVTVASEYWT